jgi:hypothetical protein
MLSIGIFFIELQCLFTYIRLGKAIRVISTDSLTAERVISTDSLTAERVISTDSLTAERVISTASLTAERKYGLSNQTKFISVVCLSHVSAFVKSHHQAIKNK